jgi:hypothetical protein
MAPRPHAFKNENELRSYCSSAAVQTEFSKFFERRVDDFDMLIRESVQANTIRAFRQKKHGAEAGPLQIYRDLCKANLAEKTQQKWESIATREQMHEFVQQLAAKLTAEWSRTVVGFDPRIQRVAKLLNLTLKYLVQWSKLDDKSRQRLIPLLDVPLDSYTIQGLRKMCPELHIRSTDSMGSITTKDRYVEFQDAITKVCGPHFYPAHYEIATWNAAHAK